MRLKASFLSIPIASVLIISSWFGPVSSAFQMPGAAPFGCTISTSSNQPLSRPNTSLDAKKILLCFDGSGTSPVRNFPNSTDEGDHSFTNVLKMHLLAGGSFDGTESTFGPDQISLYEPGVGTRTKFAMINMALGGLYFQIRPMRKQLEAVYEEGDQLYFIAFSRGSASARRFASDLYKKGIKTKHGCRVREPPIEFLGCFDTVSMQVSKNWFNILSQKFRKAIPKSKTIGEDGKIAPNIKLAVHNVALDDTRMWTGGNRRFFRFAPTLMGTEERVHEAWFPGGHGDVGGNFFYNGLSDGSFIYMQEWLLSQGIQFRAANQVTASSLSIPDHPELKANWTDIEITPDALDKIHLTETEEFKSARPIYRAKDDKMMDDATVHIHESVLDRVEGLGDKYNVNEYLKDVKFEVVTSLANVSDEKTKKLMKLLEKSPTATKTLQAP